MSYKHEYERLRRLGWRANQALAAAKLRDRFAELDGDLVKLEVEPEIDFYDDSYIDCWTHLSERARARERNELRKRINSEGHWILVAYWRPNHDADWEMADSVGGFIGDDYRDSGYDDDLRRDALDALQHHEELEAELEAARLERRATYAGASP
jgi:hypothetical protein